MDVLVEARRIGRRGIPPRASDLTDSQKSHDWVLPVMGKPEPGDEAGESSKRAFRQAIQKPLDRPDGGRRYPYVIPADGAERLASVFAKARLAQPDLPLVPELRVVLSHLLESATRRDAGHGARYANRRRCTG